MLGSRNMAGHLETLMASGRSAFAKQDWRAATDAFKQVGSRPASSATGRRARPPPATWREM
jgi:hypothetical protein